MYKKAYFVGPGYTKNEIKEIKQTINFILHKQGVVHEN